MDPAPQDDLQEGLEVHADLAKKVFEIDLLRDMILKRAIWENKKVCRSTVNSLRLVQKSWHESVTKLLQNAKEPLFNFQSNEDITPKHYIGERSKLLDQFVTAVTSSCLSTGPSVPTFSLFADLDVFLPENQDQESLSKSNMLVTCGEGLVDLWMEVPNCEASFRYHFHFPSLRLPNLRKLTIEPNHIHMTEEEGPRTTDNVIQFINSLLSAAPALTHFLVIDFAFLNFDTEHPLDIQLLNLPPSITTLEFTSEMARGYPGLLLKSQLPLLTSLKLLIPESSSLEDGVLFRILEKFRRTLNQLTLQEESYSGPPRSVTSLRFPVMENLEAFSNLSINCELEPDLSSLEIFLPKVTRMALTNQTHGMFRKWTRNSVLASVKQLVLHMANENIAVEYPNYWLGVDLEMTQGVLRAFPNVRKLNVSFDLPQVCGLQYIFTEMGQLTELQICLVGNGREFDWDSWGAVLIGAPVDFVAALRKSPGFWEQVQLTNERSPSIKNLQELTSFCVDTSCFWLEPKRKSSISDLVFHFAFLKMPKLKRLNLSHKFRPSSDKEIIWRSQGGCNLVTECTGRLI